MTDSVLSEQDVSGLLWNEGISLVLGYHPRANLNLASQAYKMALDEEKRALILDCDHTITLNDFEHGSNWPAAMLLISHPENAGELISDLKGAVEVEDKGTVIVNRPNSLIMTTDPTTKFEEKRELWLGAHGYLEELSRSCPVLILSDSRKPQRLEFMIHPALYYLCDIILGAREEGKEVKGYSALKGGIEGREVCDTSDD